MTSVEKRTRARKTQAPHVKRRGASTARGIRVGKDILELITGAMYVNPLDVYREYIQNSADSLEEKVKTKSVRGCDVTIAIDVGGRNVSIRDQGIGVSNKKFREVMTSIGDSPKRGTNARGFRGVGRLSGLGYCKELIFRSKSVSDRRAKQIVWDGVTFRRALRDPGYRGSLGQLVDDVTSVGFYDSEDQGSFFEVHLRGVIRVRNDVLLNTDAVRNYLAQVAPVGFSGDFRFGEKVKKMLLAHDIDSACRISITESDTLQNEVVEIVRPHEDEFAASANSVDEIAGVDFFEIPGLDGSIDAVGWIADHGYLGAVPKSNLTGGLRLRSKNIQIGNPSILADYFSEPRFNSWTIGEVHILNPRIVPNGRRDEFEENTHYQNFLAHLFPVLQSISRTCRTKSSTRQWMRRFENAEEAIKEDLRRLERGSVSKRLAKNLASDVDERILELDNRIDYSKYEFPRELKPRVKRLRSRLNRFLSRDPGSSEDPLDLVPQQKRQAFKEVLGLIYQYSANRVVANQLIERITKSLAAKYS